MPAPGRIALVHPGEMGAAVGAILRAEGHDVVLSIRSPHAAAEVARSGRSADAKALRWAGELEQVGETFAAAGAPDGFGRAAAQLYRTWAA